jgi:DNA-binding transcriptional MocR family regulator
MARAWEADFIRLWQAGATQAQIAQALGIPVGTVKSRAHTLQQQGTIQARPPGQRAVQTPGQTTPAHQGTPAADHAQDTQAHPRVHPRDSRGTPEHTQAHQRGTPPGYTQAHPPSRPPRYTQGHRYRPSSCACCRYCPTSKPW